MATILLTGFEPFGGESVNPSWQAVEAVAGRGIDGHTVHTRLIAVDFARCGGQLAEAIRDTRPDVVLCVGQAGGRDGISLERVAINVDDARIADNAGAQPIDEPVVPGGPAAYFSSLPIKAAVAALTADGIPAHVSQTAGTFTCNHVFYRLMHELAGGGGNARGGFVHVPFSTEQLGERHAEGTPGLPVAVIADAIQSIAVVAASGGDELRVSGGATH